MNLDRLRALKMDNDLEGVIMAGEAKRFAPLATRHQDGTAPRAVAAFNLFQTPEEIARRMSELVDGYTRILEPSAGLGRIYRALMEQGEPCREIVLVEQSQECIRELYKMTEGTGHSLQGGDFLEKTEKDLGGLFDAIVMNPPFKMGRDIKHILHAREMLKPGGRLVSLCYNGSKQRNQLEPIADSWEVLPAGSFKSEGTRAEVVILTIEKGE